MIKDVLGKDLNAGDSVMFGVGGEVRLGTITKIVQEQRPKHWKSPETYIYVRVNVSSEGKHGKIISGFKGSKKFIKVNPLFFSDQKETAPSSSG